MNIVNISNSKNSNGIEVFDVIKNQKVLLEFGGRKYFKIYIKRLYSGERTHAT